jgi:hypothetical protein
MTVKAVWQFFEAERYENSIQLFVAGSGTPHSRFQFRPRHVTTPCA